MFIFCPTLVPRPLYHLPVEHTDVQAEVVKAEGEVKDKHGVLNFKSRMCGY